MVGTIALVLAGCGEYATPPKEIANGSTQTVFVEPLAHPVDEAATFWVSYGTITHDAHAAHSDRELLPATPTDDVDDVRRGGLSDMHGQWRDLLSQYDWPIDEAERVLTCESGGNPEAVNGTSWGLFQINYPYHMSLYDDPQTLFTPAVNVSVAYTIWRDQGWGPWECW